VTLSSVARAGGSAMAEYLPASLAHALFSRTGGCLFYSRVEHLATCRSVHFFGLRHVVEPDGSKLRPAVFRGDWRLGRHTDPPTTHGFCKCSGFSDFTLGCAELYVREHERGLMAREIDGDSGHALGGELHAGSVQGEGGDKSISDDPARDLRGEE
jgi:hypothetical protein